MIFWQTRSNLTCHPLVDGVLTKIYIRCWFFGTTRTRRCIIFPHPQISQISQESTLHLFGITTGVTAFVGMCRVLGAPSKRDVVVVSAAAGAVGSIAAQVAKSYGARVIGIAGGPLPLWAEVTEVTEDMMMQSTCEKTAGNKSNLEKHIVALEENNPLEVL